MKPPPPRSTPKPYANGADNEPVSGVFRPHTGRTRRYVKWSAIIAAGASLLMPVMNAVAMRIAAPAVQPVTVVRDGGAP